VTIRIHLRVLVALLVLSGIINVVNIRIAAQWRALAVEAIAKAERCGGGWPVPEPSRGAAVARVEYVDDGGRVWTQLDAERAGP